MRIFLLSKIKRQLPGSLMLGFIIIAFFQQAIAQKVSHIKVTASNANSYRDSLKLKIFGTTVFPYDILPESITTNVNSIDYYTAGFPYSSIMYPSGNLDSIDKISVKLSDNLVDFPQNVSVYLFHPHNNNGKLFIYHSGHCAGTTTIEDILGNSEGSEPGLIIPGLLKEGYTVLAVPMIYYSSAIPNDLTCGFDGHNDLFTDNHYLYPLGFFFKPIIASLNLLGRSNYNAIYMCGLSGGGWTTSIYPAIDSSITYSFPVAGSWPMPVRYVFYPAQGDFEQTFPPLYSHLLDYHEIYTLACLAPARKMLQINNRYDECCFAGAYPHIFYADSVVNALQGSGGIFKFYLDETETGHQISTRALEIILTFTRNDTAFLQNKPTDSVTNGQAYFYDIKNNFALTTAPDNSTLKYSLLKAPDWLSLDDNTGQLNGIVPPGGIFSKQDSVSFKVEDSTGRFVVYNYNMIRKRDAPYFFTGENDSTVYFLLPYRNSISSVNPLISSFIYFNNPLLSILDITVENNSVIKLKLNMAVSATDSIGYNGFASPYALTYNNGLKLDDFGLNPIHLDAVTKNPAIAGMIRFNDETNKFEYFNGTTWINMN